MGNITLILPIHPMEYCAISHLITLPFFYWLLWVQEKVLYNVINFPKPQRKESFKYMFLFFQIGLLL